MKPLVKTTKECITFHKKSLVGTIESTIEAYVLFETIDILVLQMFFRPHEKLFEERHRPHEKVLCIKGEIVYRIDGQEVCLGENQNIEVLPNQLHSSCASEKGAEIIVILSKNQYFESFFE